MTEQLSSLADVDSALTKIKAILNTVHQPEDQQFKMHLDSLYEVCGLLQDLIESKNKGQ